MGLLLTGAIAIAATSPYFFTNLAKVYLKNQKFKNTDKRKIAQALAYLKKNRLIILKEKDNKIIVELTGQGKRKIKEYQFEDLKIEKPKTWDKKWRIVIFDIPEKLRRGRDALRDKLNNLGFYELQKSVWVYPYPCENEIQLIAEIFEVTLYINIVIAEKISNDIKAKTYFNLL